MKWLYTLALLLWLALLAGCSSHATRPSTSSRPAHAGQAPSASGGGWWHRRSSGVSDDTSRSQSERYRSANDSVPGGPPPDLSKLKEPVPKDEPRSLYGNKSPYTVLGHTYRVLASPRGYVERGIASFYGSKFDGYKTSNFENYDMYAFTAASKTLPIPSYARVTNLQNGKSVIVRINDRGPFHDDRVIDLSYVAAVKIGIWPKGTGLVEVRAIDPDHPADSPPPDAVVNGQVRAAPAQAAQTMPLATAPSRLIPTPIPAPPPTPTGPATSLPAPASTSASNPVVQRELSAGEPVPVVGPSPQIYLQVGAFSDASNADRVAQRLRDAKVGGVQVIQSVVNGRSVRRVRVGPLPDVEHADAVSTQIEHMGLPKPQVAVD